jgi:hypothetical protein
MKKQQFPQSGSTECLANNDVARGDIAFLIGLYEINQ